MSGTSSTPIFDALSLELVFKDHAAQLADECEMPSSVLAGPSSADAFRAVIRVGGRRSGRSAERADALRNLRVIQWQAERNAEHVRMMTLYSGKSIRECLSMWPTPEWKKPQPTYSDGAHKLSENTGWSLDESEDMIQRVSIWAKDAIAEDNIKTLNRSRMSKQNHYPTSTPSWARRSRR